MPSEEIDGLDGMEEVPEEVDEAPSEDVDLEEDLAEEEPEKPLTAKEKKALEKKEKEEAAAKAEAEASLDKGIVDEAAQKAAKTRQEARAKQKLQEASAPAPKFRTEFGDLAITVRPGHRSGKASSMLDAFASSPLVPTTLPIDPLNEEIKETEFQMNSLRFTIPRGKLVQVPQIVSDFINQTIYGRK